MLILERQTEAPEERFGTDEPIDPPDDSDGGDGDEGQPDRWVTIATFWSPTEAHIARIKLESEQIDCVIVDENIVATQWLWANALGGIKLQVLEPDALRASQMLQTTATRSMQAADGEPLFDGQDRCPRCGSEDIYLAKFSRRFSFLTIILIGLPLPFIQRRSRCAACGYEWKQA